jgi:long-chain acyl-CoA synthetase
MIVSSGFNVYPNQIENVIMSHKDVLNCTVVGVPHPYKQQVDKAYVVLRSGISPTHTIKNEIKELCEKNLARFSQPYEYEFRKSLPKTLIGKVDFRKLQEEDEREEELHNKE